MTQKHFFEDLDIGSKLIGDECVVDREEMLEYARRNDPSPFHVDEDAAQQSIYGGLIASAGYTVTLWYRSGIPVLGSVAFLGGFDWKIRLPAPVRENDKLRLEVTIVEKKASSKPGRGYVTTNQEILNQDNVAVFVCEVVWIVATRD